MAKAKVLRELDCQASTAQNARLIVRVRLEEMYDWSQFVDNPYHSKELHNLRIAAKRLRYTLEIFEEVLPETSKAIVEDLTQIQDALGLLHDSDVLIALLRLFLGSQDSGKAYEKALMHVRKQNKTREVILPPALVASILDPKMTPTAEARYGLEQLLQKEQTTRAERYVTFREHWYLLQEQDFRGKILTMLDQP